jgi:hypothetical protein
MNEELRELLAKPTANVPDVGRVCFGLGRIASYEAARRGDFPTVKIGRLVKVPTAALRSILKLPEA